MFEHAGNTSGTPAIIAVGITEVRPGVTIGMVEDPDGNWVEFVQNSQPAS